MQDSRCRLYNWGVIKLYLSSQPRLALDMAKRFLNKNYPERDETNFASFNMMVTPAKELASECESLSLFVDRKAVLALDCFFLTKGKWKLQAEDSLEPLLRYCQNPNPSVDLIFLVYGELDPKSELVKAIQEKGEIKEIKDPSPEELLANATMRLEKAGGRFLPGAGEEFVARIDADYARYCNEFEKIVLFANGGNISKEEVKALVAPKLEDNAFEMSNALLRGDISAAFAIYRDLKVVKTEEIQLFSMLSNSFQFMEKVSFLSSRGASKFAIANQLKSSPGRVGITLRNLSSFDERKLPLILEQIYSSCLDILSGKVEPQFAFERFLANYSI